MKIAGVSAMFRDAMPGDRRFVVPTWTRSYAGHACVGRQVYAAEQPKLVTRLLDDGARVMVLCATEAPETIFGWACGDERVLHWAYMVPEARGRGFGREMVARLCGTEAPITVTHRAPVRRAWLEFNPYRIGVMP